MTHLMTKKIRIVLVKREMTDGALAGRLETSPQNLSDKMRRDNFTIKELQKIAAALDCTLNVTLTLNDTQETV